MKTISNIGGLNGIKREFIAEANQLIHSPRGVLALFTCYMELMVNSIIKLKCKKVEELTKSNHIPLKAKVLLLYELGIIDNTLYDDIALLIKERNEAAHKFNWNFDRGIIRKLKYLKQPTNQTRLGEVKATTTPWASVCFDLLSEIGNIVFKDVVKAKL